MNLTSLALSNGATEYRIPERLSVILPKGFAFEVRPNCVVAVQVDAPAKTAAPEWGGEGLPPVGSIVENRDFGGLEVLAHGVFRGQTVIVCQGPDTIVTSSADQLRPFRTAEQIAADAQEAAVVELADTLSRTAYGQTPRDYARAAVLAGYRKP